MARKSKADKEQAKEYLLGTFGFDPVDVQEWIESKRIVEEMRQAAQSEYRVRHQAYYAKREELGRDLETEEILAVNATLPPTKYTEDEYQAATVRHNKIDDRLRDTRRVYCIVRSVSRSGMSRTISMHIVRDGRILGLSYNAATFLGRSYKDREGAVRIDGCGMDMGFALVSELSHYLFGHDYFLSRDWL